MNNDNDERNDWLSLLDTQGALAQRMIVQKYPSLKGEPSFYFIVKTSQDNEVEEVGENDLPAAPALKRKRIA
jgi:hypothetical protein